MVFIMALSEQEIDFISRYRQLDAAERYAVCYVIHNIKDGMTFEQVKEIGYQKIAEYNAGVIDKELSMWFTKSE